MTSELEILRFIISSKHREAILEVLAEAGELTPTQLSQELEVVLSQISRTLKELQDKNLVDCKTPEAKKDRIYQITEKGRKILDRKPKYTEENYTEKISDRLNENHLPYERNVQLGEELGVLSPSLIILNERREPALALEIRVGRGISSFRKGKIRSMAFMAREIKKRNEDLEVGLVFLHRRRHEENEKVLEELNRLTEEGDYFDHIFFKGEINDIIELAKKKATSSKGDTSGSEENE